MTVYVSCHFSTKMLPPVGTRVLKVERISWETAKDIIHNNDIHSVIGHSETAEFLSERLKLKDKKLGISTERISLKSGDVMIVFEVGIPRRRLRAGRVPESVLKKYPIVVRKVTVLS